MSTGQARIEISDLIALFGGIPALAEKLGVSVSMIQNWVLRNAVPDDRMDAVRTATAELGIVLDDHEADDAGEVPAAPAPRASGLPAWLAKEQETPGAPAPQPEEPATPASDRPPWLANEKVTPTPLPPGSPSASPETTAPAIPASGQPPWLANENVIPAPPPRAETAVEESAPGQPQRLADEKVIPAPPGAAGSEASLAAQSIPPNSKPTVGVGTQVSSSESRPGARPITMIGLFIVLVAGGGFFWASVLSSRQTAEDQAVAVETPPASVAAPVATPEPTPAPAPAPTPAPAPEELPSEVAQPAPEETLAAVSEEDPAAVTQAPPDPSETPAGTEPVAAVDGETSAPVPDEVAGGIEALSAMVAALETGQIEATQAIAQLRNALGALGAAVEVDRQSVRAARLAGLAPMLGQIEAALAEGRSYAGVLARMNIIAGGDVAMTAALASLEANAGGGLASDEQLRDGFARMVRQLKDEASLEKADGFFARLWSRLSSVIIVRRATDADAAADDGNLVDAIRLQLAAGNVAGAVELADRLSGTIDATDLPGDFADWRADAGARLEAVRALNGLDRAIADTLTSANR